MNIETVHQLRQYFSKNANYLDRIRKNFQAVQAEVVNIHDTQRLIILPQAYHLQQAKQSILSEASVEEIIADEELIRLDEKVKKKVEQLGLVVIQKEEVFSTASSSTSIKVNAKKSEISTTGTFFLKDMLPNTLTPLKKRKVTKEDVQTISDMTLSFFAQGLVKNNLNIFLQIAIMSEWYIEHFCFMNISRNSEELLEQIDELNAAVDHLLPFDVYEFLVLLHSRIQVFTRTLEKMVQNMKEIHRYNEKMIRQSQYPSC